MKRLSEKETVSVEPRHATPGPVANGITSQERHVRRQHQRSHADTERMAAILVRPPKGVDDTNRQEHKENEREVEKKAVQVLKQQHPRFATVAVPSRFAHGARRPKN